ncbi:MAG: dephospho-CoA kinase [Lachnospiraceae bacterium]|jgi:dephospho-CoA kinase|nr:dephospho-CoA kinase [Lachnospiraceae bacterium]MEE3461365.1 dephospho-CoA kinase [Lachnospiraceae bacterium]
MYVIGLTGGVGSGKTLAAEYINELTGAQLIISDDIGKEVMSGGTECTRRIINTFGSEIAPAGIIDRKALADVVFKDPGKKRMLEEIVHPAVKKYIKEFIDERKDKKGLIVLESAILRESHADIFCDEIWYIHADAASRTTRLQESRGYTQEKALSIMDKQSSDEEFMSQADRVIENPGKKEELKENLKMALKSLDQKKTDINRPTGSRN